MKRAYMRSKACRGVSQVSAACCGMFAFRPTHGELPVGGTTLVCPSLETVSWVAGDVARLQQVASALQLPGKIPLLCRNCCYDGLTPRCVR